MPDNSISDLSPETGYAINNVLSFRITGNVTHGTLKLGGVTLAVGDIVSAAQLAAGDLVYTHDGSENFSDSFRLIPVDDQGVGSSTPITPTNRSSTGAELAVAISIYPINDAEAYFSKSQLISGEAARYRKAPRPRLGGRPAMLKSTG